MRGSPTDPIVDKFGRPTVPFHLEREAVRNGAVVTTSADLPSIKPVAGWIRLLSDTGQVVVGNGKDWVSVATSGSPLSGFRNKIINGDFDIWQRGTSFSNLVGYGADRWNCSVSTGSGRSGAVSRQNFPLGGDGIPGAPRHYLRWNETAPGSGYDWKELQQKIEGVETLSGGKVTLTFYARMRDGGPQTIPIHLRQRFGTGGGASDAVEVANSASIQGGLAFRKYSLTFDLPSVMGKTLGTNNDDYLMLLFKLPPSSVFRFDITHVSLVEGDATWEADPFSPRHIQQELALCQRYYFAISGGNHLGSNYATGFSYHLEFPVTMRATPTVTKAVNGTPASERISRDGWSLYATGVTSGALTSFTADAEL